MGFFKKSRCNSGFHRKGNRCVASIKRERDNKSINCSGKDKKKLECSVQSPLRPIIPYFGGKTKVANKIIDKMPEHSTFIEPFAGGASVYWANNKADNFIINDKNKEVYNLYKTAKNSPNLIKSCDVSHGSKFKFNKIKSKSNKSACDVMYLHKHSYGADAKSFVKKGFRNNGFTDEHAKKLNKTKVLNQDFRKVMKSNDKSDVLQYLDPPYVVGGDTYKVHGVTPKEVCDSVKKLKKAKAIISYDNNSKVKNQCKGLKMSTISFQYVVANKKGVKNNKKSKELLITNY